MITHDQERERAIELALEHEDIELVVKHLHEEGYGGQLNDEELEKIVLEVKLAKQVMPSRPGRILPRVVGVITVVLGVTAIVIGWNAPDSLRDHSPLGYGVLAVCLGLILILKPSVVKDGL